MAIATGTAAAISAAMALAGTAAGVVGAARQAQAQRAQTQYQAKLAQRSAAIAEQNAQAADGDAAAARREGAENAARKRQEAARLIGAQRAQAGASGARVDEGAALDRVLDTAERGELDALAARQQGADAAHNHDLRAWSYRNQAQAGELEARALNEKAETDYLGGLRTTLLNGAARTGKNFYSLGVQGPRI